MTAEETEAGERLLWKYMGGIETGKHFALKRRDIFWNDTNNWKNRDWYGVMFELHFHTRYDWIMPVIEKMLRDKIALSFTQSKGAIYAYAGFRDFNLQSADIADNKPVEALFKVAVLMLQAKDAADKEEMLMRDENYEQEEDDE